jgi:pimeloyl-ACP methyl ester carboxylesterase
MKPLQPPTMPDKSFQTGYFHASEADLSYIAGPPNETPLLLIHGITSRWQPFQPLMPALAEKYHVFALDLRGHGQSSHTPGAYRLDDYTRDVYQFVTEHIQVPVVIYGHSLGALVGINLAAQQSQSVRALILGDPPLYYHDTSIQDTFWRSAFTELLEFINAHPDPTEMDAWLAQNMPGMSPERRAERVRSLETLDPDVVRAVISNQQMEGISLSTLVSRVTCPVLLLRGNPDLGSALREQDVEFALKYFSDIRVLEMVTVGHGIIPAPLLPQMMEFIATLE